MQNPDWRVPHDWTGEESQTTLDVGGWEYEVILHSPQLPEIEGQPADDPLIVGYQVNKKTGTKRLVRQSIYEDSG